MQDSTRFLSRLLGLYCLIVGVALLAHRDTALETLSALVHDRPLMYVVGVLTLFGGLAMVLVHNVWRKGVLAAVVTMIGWVTLLKGSLFLLLSPACAAAFYLGTLHYAEMFYVYTGISLMLGAYLTYSGFRANDR